MKLYIYDLNSFLVCHINQGQKMQIESEIRDDSLYNKPNDQRASSSDKARHTKIQSKPDSILQLDFDFINLLFFFTLKVPEKAKKSNDLVTTAFNQPIRLKIYKS